MSPEMTRRTAMLFGGSLALAPLAPRSSAAPGGRLKQSAALWCYSKIPVDDFCRQAAEIGLSGPAQSQVLTGTLTEQRRVLLNHLDVMADRAMAAAATVAALSMAGLRPGRDDS